MFATNNPNSSTMATYQVDMTPQVYRQLKNADAGTFELMDVETAITKIEYDVELSRSDIRKALDSGAVFTNQWSKYSMDIDKLLPTWKCRYCGHISRSDTISGADGYCAQHPTHLSGNHTFRQI
jgi:hypothetical protein